MLQTSFHTVACHVEIAAWHQVAWLASLAQHVRPRLRTMITLWVVAFSLATCVGFLATFTQILVVPYLTR